MNVIDRQFFVAMAMLREVKHSVFFLIITIALAVTECQYERSEAVITKIYKSIIM